MDSYASIFPEVNLPKLKERAEAWAKRYPVISKIVLYPGICSGVNYVLVVEPSRRSTLNFPLPFLLHLGVCPSDIAMRNYRKYLNDWTDPLCSHIQKDLASAMAAKPSPAGLEAFLNEWLCYNKRPEEGLPTGILNEKYPYVLNGEEVQRSEAEAPTFPHHLPPILPGAQRGRNMGSHQTDITIGQLLERLGMPLFRGPELAVDIISKGTIVHTQTGKRIMLVRPYTDEETAKAKEEILKFKPSKARDEEAPIGLRLFRTHAVQHIARGRGQRPEIENPHQALAADIEFLDLELSGKDDLQRKAIIDQAATFVVARKDAEEYFPEAMVKQQDPLVSVEASSIQQKESTISRGDFLLHERIMVLMEALGKLEGKPNKSLEDFDEIDELNEKLFKAVKDHPDRFRYIRQDKFPAIWKRLPPLTAPEDESQKAPPVAQEMPSTEREVSPTNRKEFLLCDPGTKWDEIEITLISDDAVRIRTPKGMHRLSYSEMGLSDKRKGDKPSRLWILLERFCETKGTIQPKGKVDQSLYKAVSDLNTKLQKFFGIPESFLSGGRYQERKGYVAKIHFADQRDAQALQMRTDGAGDGDLIELMEDEESRGFATGCKQKTPSILKFQDSKK
jgi:hypothetical protein